MEVSLKLHSRKVDKLLDLLATQLSHTIQAGAPVLRSYLLSEVLMTYGLLSKTLHTLTYKALSIGGL